MYCLDTNTVIYFFKQHGQVAQALLSKSPRDIHLPAIVVFEIEFGIAKAAVPDKRRQQWNTFLEQVRILPFNKREAITAAALRADLERTGQPIGPYDVLIAATALANKLVLVTHNTREFGRVEYLTVEDWY